MTTAIPFIYDVVGRVKGHVSHHYVLAHAQVDLREVGEIDFPDAMSWEPLIFSGNEPLKTSKWHDGGHWVPVADYSTPLWSVALRGIHTDETFKLLNIRNMMPQNSAFQKFDSIYWENGSEIQARAIDWASSNLVVFQGEIFKRIREPHHTVFSKLLELGQDIAVNPGTIEYAFPPHQDALMHMLWRFPAGDEGSEAAVRFASSVYNETPIFFPSSVYVLMEDTVQEDLFSASIIDAAQKASSFLRPALDNMSVSDVRLWIQLDRLTNEQSQDSAELVSLMHELSLHHPSVAILAEEAREYLLSCQPALRPAVTDRRPR